MRLIIVFAMLGAALLFGSAASSEDKKNQAIAAFEKGKEAFLAGRFSEAAAEFRRANQLNPNWKLFFNIAQSEAAAKRPGPALEAFEQYLSAGGDDVPEARREEVLVEVERLRKMVGTVEVKAPRGASVFLDGVDRGKAPLLGRLPVAASVKHEVWAVLDGKRIAQRAFKVMGGDNLVVELEMPSEEQPPLVGPAVAPQPETQPEPQSEPEPVQEPLSDQPGRGLLIGGIASTALGAVGIAVGIYFSAKWNQHVDEVGDVAAKANSAETLEERLRLEAEYEDAKNEVENDKHPADRAGMIAGYTIGGALVVTGVVLLVLHGGQGQEDEPVSLGPATGGLLVRF